jgi:OOP family OmpA-OmpF porin
LASSALPGYLTESNGQVVRNAYGECWHTGSWTPAMAVVGCDGRVAAAVPVSVPAPLAARPRPEPILVRTHFDFDRADLKAEDRAKLDELATHLKTEPVERLAIAGHADRIGTDEYNQALSLRRAKAVQQYLAERQTLDPARVEVTGKGETEPLVACDGVRGRQRLIACLAPNRRAEIRVEAGVGP